jgi:hypothetical protein
MYQKILKYTVIKQHFKNERNTRIIQNIPKLYRHTLPKYTKVNNKNTKQYLVYSWSKFTLFFHKCFFFDFQSIFRMFVNFRFLKIVLSDLSL